MLYVIRLSQNLYHFTNNILVYINDESYYLQYLYAIVFSRRMEGKGSLHFVFSIIFSLFYPDPHNTVIRGIPGVYRSSTDFFERIWMRSKFSFRYNFCNITLMKCNLS